MTCSTRHRSHCSGACGRSGWRRPPQCSQGTQARSFQSSRFIQSRPQAKSWRSSRSRSAIKSFLSNTGTRPPRTRKKLCAQPFSPKGFSGHPPPEPLFSVALLAAGPGRLRHLRHQGPHGRGCRRASGNRRRPAAPCPKPCRPVFHVVLEYTRALFSGLFSASRL